MRVKRNVRGAIQTIGAFALGAAAGSITALLLAPVSGQVARRRIGQRVRRIQQQAARRLDRTRRTLARRAESLREATAGQLEGARVWVNRHLGNGHNRRTARRVLRHA